MEANQFLSDVLTFMQTSFGLLIGVVVVQLIAFFLLANLIANSKKPHEVGSAIFGYFMLAIGVLLMSLSGVTTLIGLLGQSSFSTEIYLGLLLIFATGGLLYLWHDYRIRELPAAAKQVPATIYFFTIKAIGQLSIVLSALYMALNMTLTHATAERWWSMPLSIFVYGFCLTWLTAVKERKGKKK